MKLIPTDTENLHYQETRGILVNSDNEGYRAYMARVNALKSKDIELDNVKEELNNLKDEISSIKLLLQQILSKV